MHKFLQNPFDNREISLDELLSFCGDHLQRLTAQNPGGIFTARIAATTAALNVLSGSATEDQTKLGLRKAKKMAKDAFRLALPGEVAKFHGAVVAHFGPVAPEVAECFPQGRKVFGSCTDDKVMLHLQTLVNGLAAHVVEMGSETATNAQAVLENWGLIFEASEASGGAKVLTQQEKKEARDALQLELFKTLLTISLQFPREPEKLDLYMQQSLLEDHPTEPEPIPPLTP